MEQRERERDKKNGQGDRDTLSQKGHNTPFCCLACTLAVRLGPLHGNTNYRKSCSKM